MTNRIAYRVKESGVTLQLRKPNKKSRLPVRVTLTNDNKADLGYVVLNEEGIAVGGFCLPSVRARAGELLQAWVDRFQ